MKVLLDTCVVSELHLPSPNASVVAWVTNLDAEDTFLSAITIGELVYGIELLPQGKRKRELALWLTAFETDFHDRILPVASDIARTFGEIMAQVKTAGYTIQVTDGLIAATAIHHELHVVTRNVKHFEPTGALVINPWDE